jgi:hypothetical protein
MGDVCDGCLYLRRAAGGSECAKMDSRIACGNCGMAGLIIDWHASGQVAQRPEDPFVPVCPSCGYRQPIPPIRSNLSGWLLSGVDGDVTHRPSWCEWFEPEPAVAASARPVRKPRKKAKAADKAPTLF